MNRQPGRGRSGPTSGAAGLSRDCDRRSADDARAPRPRRSAGAPEDAPIPSRARLVRVILLTAALMLVRGGVLTVHGQGEAQIAAQITTQPADSLLITPTTQGTFTLPTTGITLEIAYATVHDPTHLTVTRAATGLTIHATNRFGAALARFEMPLVLHGDRGSQLIGWPGAVPEPVRTRWLVVFDAHGLYALPADAPAPDSVLYLGPLEHYAPDLIQHDLTWGTVTFEAAPPVERTIIRREGGQSVALPTAARTERFRDRFIPEDLSNPGGFMLLGWTDTPGLGDLARALRGTIPNDPDLPAPGLQDAPLDLILPFDCALDWAISWGYHHSTPQNRFAVDFAPLVPGEHPVYAAHAGTVYLKRFGTADQMIDTGLTARIVAADGVTSTVYGHLAPDGTLERWGLGASDLIDFEWVRVGTVAQGEMIGIMGRTGYATGPHIHFALWAWDQSLYQPLPLGPLTDQAMFVRGQPVPAALRNQCDVYRG
jgi:murein DD-endopeptidase MepM/ murein hydrolase activator NlpD